MSRFVIRYRGTGNRPSQVVDRVRGVDGVRVLDDSGRMLLVEGPEAPLQHIFSGEKDWVLTPERFMKLPDPREHIQGS